MEHHSQELSAKTIAVLEMIAAGSSYEQILSAYPHLTYLDIFDAATEALDFASMRGSDARPGPAAPTYQAADIRKSYPRAYEKWTDGEEHKLRALIDDGLTVAQISHRLPTAQRDSLPHYQTGPGQ